MKGAFGAALDAFQYCWSYLASIRVAEWIGIAGFLLAARKYLSEARRARRDAHRQEVLSIIANIRAICAEAAEEIERHLCFQKARKSKEDIYRILKRANRELDSLKLRLPAQKGSVMEAYVEWYRVMTGDGFPVEKKTAAFKSTDERVRLTGDAQTKFEAALDKLRLDCLADRVRYWQ